MSGDPLLSYEAERALQDLGRRLKRLRVDRGDTQARFAARLGVSAPTLAAMEHGEPTTRIGYWIEAMMLLGRKSDVLGLLESKASLFDRR